MLCQLHNDCTALLQLVMSNFPREDEFPARQAHRAVACFMGIRVLAGRMEEGWKTMKDRFAGIFKTYESKMPPARSASYKELRAYMSGKNLIRLLRDNASFHFDRELFRRGYKAIGETDEFVDYHSRGVGNTVYWGAEGVLSSAVIELVLQQRPDLSRSDALIFVLSEVSRVARLFIDVFSAFLNQFYRTHLPKALKDMEHSHEIVPDQPSHELTEGVSFIYSETDINPNARSRRNDLMGSTSRKLFTPPFDPPA